MIKRQGMRRVWIGTLLGMAALLDTTASHADTVGTKVYESTTLVTHSQIDLQTLSLNGAGTVTVKFADLQWPDLLGSLSFTLFDVTHTIGTFSLDSSKLTTGSGVFHVDSAGTYYASIFAAPGAGKSGGLYNAQVYFSSAAPPVPLPAAGWLLLSGIAGIVAFRPKQKLSQMYA